MNDILEFDIDNTTIRSFLEGYHVGKKKIYDLFLKKAIQVDGKFIGYDVKASGRLAIDLSNIEARDFPPFDSPLDVIYEDNDILIINKPKNIIIYPEFKDGNNTLVNIVSSYFEKNNINRNIRYVHRLDLDTTGIILFTKHFLAQSMLDYEMENDIIKRKYLALCHGKTGSGTINKNIGRDRHNNKMICYDKGVSAITHYTTIKTNGSISLVSILLDTGRTHQIRVHFQAISHPLLGDIMYGGKNNMIKRVALHSSYLSLVHPITKKTMEFTVDAPADMREIIKQIL